MDQIQPVSREKSLSENVYDQLKSGLMNGSYEPGEKVTMRGIADAAAVSFTPAREAVGRLISEGALENAGPKTVVVPPLTRESLEEITSIRISLECMVTKAGVTFITESDLRKLTKIQDMLEAAMERSDFRKVLLHNNEFHFLLYRKSGFDRAIRMIESCWTRIGPSLNLLYPEFSLKREGVHNHRQILADLREEAFDKIPAHIERDIRGGYELLSQSFSD